MNITCTLLQPEHLTAVIDLCTLQGYTSYTADSQRTWQALTAPGVITIVALQQDRVVGVAQIQSDGIIQAHLTLILVYPAFRKQGIGRGLIQEAFKYTGAQRMDLITEDAQDFYRSLPHKEWFGFRIYPED